MAAYVQVLFSLACVIAGEAHDYYRTSPYIRGPGWPLIDPRITTKQPIDYKFIRRNYYPYHFYRPFNPFYRDYGYPGPFSNPVFTPNIQYGVPYINDGFVTAGVPYTNEFVDNKNPDGTYENKNIGKNDDMNKETNTSSNKNNGTAINDNLDEKYSKINDIKNISSPADDDQVKTNINNLNVGNNRNNPTILLSSKPIVFATKQPPTAPVYAALLNPYAVYPNNNPPKDNLRYALIYANGQLISIPELKLNSADTFAPLPPSDNQKPNALTVPTSTISGTAINDPNGPLIIPIPNNLAPVSNYPYFNLFVPNPGQTFNNDFQSYEKPDTSQPLTKPSNELNGNLQPNVGKKDFLSSPINISDISELEYPVDNNSNTDQPPIKEKKTIAVTPVTNDISENPEDTSTNKTADINNNDSVQPDILISQFKEDEEAVKTNKTKDDKEKKKKDKKKNKNKDKKKK